MHIRSISLTLSEIETAIIALATVTVCATWCLLIFRIGLCFFQTTKDTDSSRKTIASVGLDMTVRPGKSLVHDQLQDSGVGKGKVAEGAPDAVEADAAGDAGPQAREESGEGEGEAKGSPKETECCPCCGKQWSF